MTSTTNDSGYRPMQEREFRNFIATDEHEIREQIEALHRLAAVAKLDTGQPRIVAAFLLNLHWGSSYPFDMTDFNGLHRTLFADCMAVLKLNFHPRAELYEHLPEGRELFPILAIDHEIPSLQERIEKRRMIP
ncbi:MAG: hypothetical protein JWL97_4343 [Gemmatimonadales bacterium]|nr:hypothetical protein [Gemmatimonadales bacterium]